MLLSQRLDFLIQSLLTSDDRYQTSDTVYEQEDFHASQYKRDELYHLH